MAAKVGALLCQKSPFARSITTKVNSCELCPVVASKGGESSLQQLYHVILEDSVLFPEGGGQPCDYGTINGTIAVRNVQRRGDQCVLYIPEAIEVGKEVTVELDWPRRLDHMQHHTGQHLLSAILVRELNLPTEGWSLTHPACYLQLPTAKIEQSDIQRVEEICNEYIRQEITVEVQMFATREDLPPVRSRGMPDDVTGPFRIVTIHEDVDSCTCCGTHLQNLGQIQMIKILHQDPKGNTMKLHFICGDRVVRNFSAMFWREKALIKELGALPEDIVSKVEKRGKDVSELTKTVKKLLTEVATLSSSSIAKEAAEFDLAKVFTYYREDADMDFLTVIGEKCKTIRTTLLYCGKGPADGQLLIVGPKTDEVKKLGDIVCANADGKGGCRADAFRGKCDAKKLKQYVKKSLDTHWTA